MVLQSFWPHLRAGHRPAIRARTNIKLVPSARSMSGLNFFAGN